LYLDFSDFGNFFKGETLKTEWQLLKGQTVSTNWEWPKPRFGAYTFQATVRYAGVEGIEEVTTDPVTVTVIPWIEIIVLLLLIVGILLVFMVKRMRFGGKKWKEYQVQSGDQLGVLATQSGVSWKKLAKMNRLKEPVVHPGQTILMPPSFVPTIKTPVVAEAPVTQSVVASGPVPSTVEAPRRRRVAPRKTTATRKRAPRKKKASQPENESL
jgi:LysM repeat protein